MALSTTYRINTDIPAAFFGVDIDGIVTVGISADLITKNVVISGRPSVIVPYQNVVKAFTDQNLFVDRVNEAFNIQTNSVIENYELEVTKKKYIS